MNYQGALLAGLLCIPAVELGSADGEGIVLPVGGKDAVPIADTVAAFLGQVPDTGFDNVPLYGTAALDIVGEYPGQVVTIEDAAGHILRPGVFASLKDNGFDAGICQDTGRRDTGRAGANDGDIKSFFHLWPALFFLAAIPSTSLGTISR